MKPSIITIAIILLASCSGKENPYDATGTFEAVETIVPAEVAGTIQVFNVSEGVSIAKGATVGYIDSIQLYLKKKQVLAQIRSVLSKRPDVATQLAALEEQLRQAEKEMQRIARLLKSDAATQKQYDDASTQVKIIERQIDAQTSTLGIATASLTEETLPLRVQIEQLNDQLSKCRIVNPVAGTVLTKYAEAYEMTAVGKPLYKIADLSTIILRAYVTGEQLPGLKLGQPVTVLTDQPDDAYKEYPGTVTWISDKAEFTPKTIQTKDERANLVYAVKISVKNDGQLKIGMYGEVKL
ncbi:MAG TPA: HlyD family efflux transporter periplasmic adaptor subunit [Ohtaekwangia sp.]|nr:HlyD family efflux transporter periplasmic adaptor subunit [Ohtaekwangia sp.]